MIKLIISQNFVIDRVLLLYSFKTEVELQKTFKKGILNPKNEIKVRQGLCASQVLPWRGW